MSPTRVSRTFLFLLVGLLLLVAIFLLIYRFYYEQESTQVEERVRHYQKELHGALTRYRYLPFALIDNPAYAQALTSSPLPGLNDTLRDLSQRSGVEAIYLMDETGLTIAASNAGESPTFLGQTYGFRPYFRDALESGQGEFFAIGATTSIPGYFFARRVTGPEGNALGVLAVKISLDPLIDIWRELAEFVFVTDANGVVVLASEESWQYRSTEPLTPGKREIIRQERQFGNQPLEMLPIENLSNREARIDGTRFLTASERIETMDWVLHYQYPQSAVLKSAAGRFVAFTAPVILIMAVWLAVTSSRRQRALVQSRLDGQRLRELNEKLELEIAERRITESRLEEAQQSLEKVSRLAALGQVSASVTHELGQPVSALQNYVASMELPDSDLGKDGQELVAKTRKILKRINHITGQLKFFARPGEDNLEEFDLVTMVRNAINLHFAGLDRIMLTMMLPEQPVKVSGDRLRLEQVLVNLLRNSQQATESVAEPAIAVELNMDTDTIELAVSDNGPGIDAADRERIFEPFYTTKASGVGMGLGLVISSAIMKEHDGHIDVSKSQSGGARFCMVLPRKSGGAA